MRKLALNLQKATLKTKKNQKLFKTFGFFA